MLIGALEEEAPEDSASSNEASAAASPAASVGESAKTVYKCDHCNFTTFMSQHIKSHMKTHERYEGKMFQCDVCQMQFSQRANMTRHRQRHNGVKPYECRYCQRTFFRKDQMQEHALKHVKSGDDFDCPISKCAGRFSQYTQLVAHLKEGHTITVQNQAACKLCSHLFTNPRRILHHYHLKHDVARAMGPASSDQSSERSDTNETPDSNNDHDPAEEEVLRESSSCDVKPTVINSASVNSLQQTVSLMSTIAGRLATFAHGARFGAALLDPGANTGMQYVGAVPLSNTLWPPLHPVMALPEGWNSCEGNEAVVDTVQATVPEEHHSPVAKSTLPMRVPKMEILDAEASMSKGGLAAEQWSCELETFSGNAENSAAFSSDLMPPLQLWSNEADGSTLTTTVDVVDNTSTRSNSSAREVAEIRNTGLAARVTPQRCDHCGIDFHDSILYLLHGGLHSNGDPWRCNLCGESFASKYEFHLHIIRASHGD
ncbi:Protein ZTF-16 a [Aphelenchoides avenae]|nr:Protein ZTF-16 a [Aphelenchus avenae]